MKVFLTIFIISSAAANKFDLTLCKKVNNDLVAAVDEIVVEIFAPKYRTTNFIAAYEDLYDCHLQDFKTQLFNRSPSKFNAYRLLNYTAIPKITSRMRVINVIFLDSLKSFEKIYSKIVPEVFNFRGYYLFVMLKENSNDVHEIFTKMWQKRIYNVNAIYVIPGAINMSTFKPFRSESCYDVSPIIVDQYINGSFLKGNESSNLYPKKFENLWKCEITVVTLDRCPAVCEIKNSSKFFGHDWDLITELERTLNFSIKLIFLRESAKHGNSTGLAAAEMVLKGKADILIGNYFVRAEFVDKMDMSETYDSVPIVFAIPAGKKISSFEKLLQPFEKKVWLILIGTLLIGLLVILIIEVRIKQAKTFVYGTKVTAPVLNMIIAIFGSQQPILPRRNFARFLLMMFLIFCLVNRNIYQGALYIFLQSDGRHKPMKSIEEMIRNDFVFYMHPRMISMIMDHKEIFTRKKIASNDSELPFSREVDENFHAAFLTTLNDVIYRNEKTYKKFSLNVCDERFSLVNIVMYFPKNFFLKKTIDKKISELLSSGILHHWIEKYINERFLDVKVTNERKKLSLNHLFGVFNILLIGYAIACISLIIEITISKAKEYGRVKKSMQNKGRKRDVK